MCQSQLLPLCLDMSPRKPSKNRVDDDIVDLVEKISREEKEEEALMKAEINDAVHKWCSLLLAAHQTRIAFIALAAFICSKARDIMAEDAFSVAGQHSIDIIEMN